MDSLADLVEQGRQRTLIAKKMLERDILRCPKIVTIEDCMKTLGNLDEIPSHITFMAIDIFQVEATRQAYMTLPPHMRMAWLQAKYDASQK